MAHAVALAKSWRIPAKEDKTVILRHVQCAYTFHQNLFQLSAPKSTRNEFFKENLESK